MQEDLTANCFSTGPLSDAVPSNGLIGGLCASVFQHNVTRLSLHQFHDCSYHRFHSTGTYACSYITKSVI